MRGAFSYSRFAFPYIFGILKFEAALSQTTEVLMKSMGRHEYDVEHPLHRPLACFEEHGWIIDYTQLMGFAVFPEFGKRVHLRNDLALFPENGMYSMSFRGYLFYERTPLTLHFLSHLTDHLTEEKGITFSWAEPLIFSIVKDVECPTLFEDEDTDKLLGSMGKHFLAMRNFAVSCAHVIKTCSRISYQQQHRKQPNLHVDGLVKFCCMALIPSQGRYDA